MNDGRAQRVYQEGPLSFLWLELTGKCNLRCVHCYAESGPYVPHGRMSSDRWRTVISDARELGARMVQFIGGEPTLHPDFSDLVRHARSRDLSIEVYTNLTRMRPSLWALFEECEVALATSFYSADPRIHQQITLRPTHQKTLENIMEALRREIPLRVGIIQVSPEQDVSEAESLLRSLGVVNVGVDQMRSVGRAAERVGTTPSPDALCGACGKSNAAIGPDGSVYPCVFSRWLPAGNVMTARLADVMQGQPMVRTKEALNAEFGRRAGASKLETLGDNFAVCGPGSCNPNCVPSCGPSCNPANQPSPCMPGCFP